MGRSQPVVKASCGRKRLAMVTSASRWEERNKEVFIFFIKWRSRQYSGKYTPERDPEISLE
jgi:hypothetical protein